MRPTRREDLGWMERFHLSTMSAYRIRWGKLNHENTSCEGADSIQPIRLTRFHSDSGSYYTWNNLLVSSHSNWPIRGTRFDSDSCSCYTWINLLVWSHSIRLTRFVYDSCSNYTWNNLIVSSDSIRPIRWTRSVSDSCSYYTWNHLSFEISLNFIRKNKITKSHMRRSV